MGGQKRRLKLKGKVKLRVARPVRRADVLYVPRPTPEGPHDLDRSRPNVVFTVRTYATRRAREP
jgi:hypothetical protein